MSEMTTSDKLVSVLCDSEGKVVIEGSDGDRDILQKAIAEVRGLEDEDRQARLIASAIAHRVCIGAEHDSQNGKIHGYCVICGIPWPCETAKTFMADQALRFFEKGGACV